MNKLTVFFLDRDEQPLGDESNLIGCAPSSGWVAFRCEIGILTYNTDLVYIVTNTREEVIRRIENRINFKVLYNTV